MAADSMPMWATIALALVSPIGTAIAFVFGRMSSASVDRAMQKLYEQRLSVVEKLVNDTVITVSNHGQILSMTQTRLSTIEGQLTELIQSSSRDLGILLERTKAL